MSAESHKARGNAHYLANELEDAIAAYTRAIVQSPNVAVYYTNRALCHLKQKRWDLVIVDAEKALSLDDSLIKGHFLLGHALLESQQTTRALASLQTAYKLSQQGDRAHVPEIVALLLAAKKKRWQEREDQRLASSTELFRHLRSLLQDEAERGAAANPADREALQRKAAARSAELQAVFEQANENMKRRDIPDYMFGNISFELLRDPVIAPSGVTYERESILEHLRRVGRFDPVTRSALTEAQLVPNLVMKEVVEDFVSKNGWAADF